MKKTILKIITIIFSMASAVFMFFKWFSISDNVCHSGIPLHSFGRAFRLRINKTCSGLKPHANDFFITGYRNNFADNCRSDYGRGKHNFFKNSRGTCKSYAHNMVRYFCILFRNRMYYVYVLFKKIIFVQKN